MGIRKNQATLTDDEKQRFNNAVLRLKANGDYEKYVLWHRDLFNRGIHNSGEFLPWHRELILRFERDLQAIDPSVDLPYWDWTVDRALDTSPFTASFLGGDGAAPSFRVTDGPYAFSTGNFNLVIRDFGDSNPALRRQVGSPPPLPTSQEVRQALRSSNYRDLNRRIAGNIHNFVHRWVGGSMAEQSSPNDPVFFMHHCNLDRLWSVWQTRNPSIPHFTGANTPMQPWLGTTTPSTVVDHRTLGYQYDTDPDAVVAPITQLIVGATATAADISRGAEIDMFQFTVASFGTYVIESQGQTDVVMSLFGPDSQTDLVTENDDGGEGLNARIVSNLSNGTYFVAIRHYNRDRTGPYNISVRVDNPLAIPEIPVNGAIINGEIAVSNESDLYIFSATSSAIYTIQSSGGTDTFLTLYGPNSQSNLLDFDDDSGQDLNGRIDADLSNGIYYLRVRHYSATGTGQYGIKISR